MESGLVLGRAYRVYFGLFHFRYTKLTKMNSTTIAKAVVTLLIITVFGGLAVFAVESLWAFSKGGTVALLGLITVCAMFYTYIVVNAKI